MFFLFIGRVFASDESIPVGVAAPQKQEKEAVSLEDCIILAFHNHPELKASLAMRRAAGEQLTQVRAAYFPRVTFSSSYNRSSSNLIQHSGNLDSYGNTFSVSQRIYDFGRTDYAVLSARENLKSVEYDLLNTADNIILDIRESYYAAVAANKFLEVGQESVKQQELHLKQAIGFYQVGTRSKIEVTQAEVALSNAKLELIKAENNIKVTRLKLANAIGVKGSFTAPLEDEMEFIELKMDLERALEYAASHRPDVLKIDTTKRIYKARIGQTIAELYPAITANTTYGYGNEKFNFERNNWSWGVSLNLDVFSGGAKRAAINESKANLQSIEAHKERLWQNIQLEVSKAYLAMEEARQSIDVLEKSLDSARENFLLAQARYEVGLGDNLEFTDARLGLQKAQNDLIRSILEYQTARSRLEKAVGMSVFKPKLYKEFNILGENNG